MLDWLPPLFNGTLRAHYVLLFSIAGGIAVIAGLAGAWLGARFGSRRLIDEVMDRLPGRDDHEMTRAQLSRLSEAVDVMAVEIERLSEGQRYAARLLAQRGASPSAAPARPEQPPVITPH